MQYLVLKTSAQVPSLNRRLDLSQDSTSGLPASIVRIRFALLLDCQGRSLRKVLSRIVGCWLFGNTGFVSNMELFGCLC